MAKKMIFVFKVRSFVFCFFFFFFFCFFFMDELALNDITLILSVDMNTSM
jgi:hypothetical protein